MKTYIKLLSMFTCIMLASCTDVIDVETSEGKTRLVIEASLDWEKGTTGNDQSIKLSQSTPYFSSNTDVPATGATVVVTNDNSGETYNFVDQNDGTYTINDFIPVINDSYTLEVVYNGETYTANETLMAVPEINRVEQSLEGAFDDELIDIYFYFDDPEDEENYYLISFKEEGDLLQELEEMSDEFSNGNEMFNFWEKEEDEDNNQEPFVAGDVIQIVLYGISQGYHSYMQLLIEQYYSGGDPFSTIPAEIKGNCINVTNADNYANGYFRVAEVDKVTYTIQ